MRGDHIERPQGGSGRGSGSGKAGDSGEGEDDFVFHLTKEEFMQIFFDDLALPRLVRSQLVEMPEMKSQRAGYSSTGTPSNLSVIRSMRGAIGRRVAIGAGSRAELRALAGKLAELPEGSVDPAVLLARETLEAQIAALRARLERIPYLDPIDLRFRNRVRLPIPTAKAVMFCLMDVSGSMDEARKDLSKRFFILLYLFLTRHYEKIDLVFIRHHTQAQEVDEENFFRARETGGTVVSSALVLMDEIITERYSQGDWNIYGAQASDGDNWHHDSGRCRELLTESLLPKCRYFAYVQVAEEEQNLWEEYARLQETAAQLRDEEGHRPEPDLPGVPRPLQARGGGRMKSTTRRHRARHAGPAERAAAAPRADDPARAAAAGAARRKRRCPTRATGPSS